MSSFLPDRSPIAPSPISMEAADRFMPSQASVKPAACESPGALAIEVVDRSKRASPCCHARRTLLLPSATTSCSPVCRSLHSVYALAGRPCHNDSAPHRLDPTPAYHSVNSLGPLHAAEREREFLLVCAREDETGWVPFARKCVLLALASHSDILFSTFCLS